MSLPHPLRPLPAERFDRRAARHLLARAGFAGTPAEVAAMQARGLDGAVHALVHFETIPAADLPEPKVDPDVLRKLTQAERAAYVRARRANDQDTLDEVRRKRLEAQATDRRMIIDLGYWWVHRMVNTPRPLEEKLTLLWHGHFATGYRVVRDTYLMYQQNEMFRQNVYDFKALARGIVHDPAMIIYLNNDRNNKRKPNENLARELMELFTLGEGNYSEQDIKEGARALTGYFRDDNEFIFRERAHDDGDKTILGATGDYDGDDFVDILLRQPSCPQYIALKLYRHFVADVSDYLEEVPPEDRVAVEAMAADLRSSGYDVRQVLTRLFASEHFYSDAVVGRKIKSPVEFMVGTTRQLGLPERNRKYVGQAMNMMGQAVFNPPSVAGWPVGRGWINTSSLFLRQNLAAYLITNRAPQHMSRKKWKTHQAGYDPMPWLEAAGLDVTTATAADVLVDEMVSATVSDAAREPLRAFVREQRELDADTVMGLMVLITALPEYQLC